MPIESRGKALIERLASNIWFMFIIGFSLAALIASVWVVADQSVTKDELKQFAKDRAAAVDKSARQRAIDICNRGMPGRAYLLLRSEEVASSTAATAHLIYAILNCDATVDHGGDSIPVSPEVEHQYLELFKNCRIGILEDGMIVDVLPFEERFHRPSSCRPAP